MAIGCLVRATCTIANKVSSIDVPLLGVINNFSNFFSKLPDDKPYVNELISRINAAELLEECTFTRYSCISGIDLSAKFTFCFHDIYEEAEHAE
ncbi:hypothetical protein M569_12172 [Genlisea aurea]|uniref:Uncharacterized protein n=1 Tax=Genlisea aurea TaxID=192259 RepID=S8DIH7_9LAMI|nr:hypothetical protein M569_12172 [Genlisea aurea]